MLTLRRAAVVYLAVISSLSIISARADDLPLDDLFVYKGKHYSLEDLTLVSAADTRKFIQEAATKYDITKDKIAILPPAQQAWDASTDPGVDGYFKLQLQGIAECFVHYQVLQLYLEKCNLKAGDFWDEKSLENAIFEQARLRSMMQEAAMTLVEKNETPEIFLADIRNIYPHWNFTDKEGLPLYTMAGQHQALRMLNSRCFPLFKDGKVAPWYSYGLNGMIDVLITAEIEKHKQQYIDQLEDLWGSRTGFMVSNATPKDFPALRTLIASVATDDGSIAPGGDETINAKLAAMGSPAHVDIYFGAKTLIVDAYKIPAEMVRPKRFVDLGNGTFLYYVQVKPTRHFTEYPSGGGHILHDLVAGEIIPPLYEEVISSLKLSHGITLEPRFIGSAGYLDAGGQFGGEKIPEIKFKLAKKE